MMCQRLFSLTSSSRDHHDMPPTEIKAFVISHLNMWESSHVIHPKNQNNVFSIITIFSYMKHNSKPKQKNEQELCISYKTNYTSYESIIWDSADSKSPDQNSTELGQKTSKTK